MSIVNKCYKILKSIFQNKILLFKKKKEIVDFTREKKIILIKIKYEE